MTLDDMLAAWSRRDVLGVAGLGLLSVLLWRVPVLGLLFYPFRLLNTFVHELAHGFAAVATGGRFVRFAVFPNTEGRAIWLPGSPVVVFSAGYIGAALVGGLLVALTAVDVPAQVVLIWLALILGLLCLLFARNLFGLLAGLALAAALAYAGWWLDNTRATQLLLLLAVQTTLSSFDSLIVLVRLAADPRFRHTQSDAHRMGELTGIPALFWALLWGALAVGVLTVAVTWAYGTP